MLKTSLFTPDFGFGGSGGDGWHVESVCACSDARLSKGIKTRQNLKIDELMETLDSDMNDVVPSNRSANGTEYVAAERAEAPKAGNMIARGKREARRPWLATTKPLEP